jgi:TRAP-type C4-dicarboxylate transport system permease small subunit
MFGWICLLLALLIVSLIVFQWYCWLLCKGRFSNKSPAERDSRGGVVRGWAYLINDFRHLLALILVVAFIGGIITMGVLGYRRCGIEGAKDAMNVIITPLSGLIGSVIGYYFGATSKGATTEGNQQPSGGGAVIEKLPSDAAKEQ